MAVLMHSTGQLYVMERLSQMPPKTHRKLRRRVGDVTDALRARVVSATPVLTGKLQSEISSRLYADNPSRVAGYVFVATMDRKEIAKAASLEYGIKGTPRAIADASAPWMRLAHSSKRIRARLSRPVNLAPRRYLRGPFEETRAEFAAAVAEAVGEVSAETAGELK